MNLETWDLTITHGVSGKEVGRPRLHNTEQRGHWGARANSTGIWKRAATAQAEALFIPHLEAVVIQIIPLYRGGVMPDVGAQAPTVKAVIDGLVEAEVVPDDNPPHVQRIIYERPVSGRRFDGLGVRVIAREHDQFHGPRSRCGCAEIRRRRAARRDT